MRNPSCLLGDGGLKGKPMVGFGHVRGDPLSRLQSCLLGGRRKKHLKTDAFLTVRSLDLQSIALEAGHPLRYLAFPPCYSLASKLDSLGEFTFLFPAINCGSRNAYQLCNTSKPQKAIFDFMFIHAAS